MPWRSRRWYPGALRLLPLVASLWTAFLRPAPAQWAPEPLQPPRKALQQNEAHAARRELRRLAAAPTGGAIDVSSYRLVLRIDTPPAFPHLQGSMTMQARALGDSLASVTLDLTGTMTVDSVVMGARHVQFTQPPSGVPGTPAAELRITLDRPYRAGEVLTLTVHYQGTPPSTGFGSFTFGSHGASSTPWVWTLSEPYGARDWWPCKDHPTDKADSVDVIVTCDARLRVGSNGRLVSVRNNGDGTSTTHWSERYPIATYLVSVTISDFVEAVDWFHQAPADSMPVVNYLLPEQLPYVRDEVRRTLDMLRVFSDLYGPYPFLKEKYGHASFGWGGAMEHQTMTSMTSYDEFTIAHELAHQWFGDMITMRTWRDIWLNEGFATYSEALYAERAHGTAQFRNFFAPILAGAQRARGTLSVQDTSDLSQLFSGTLVYDKGAAVLHMLRHVLGDSVFFLAMRSYAADPALMYRTASTGDFRRVCETVSGRPLGYFFDEWIYGEGYPRYVYGWDAASSESGVAVTVRITQSPSAGSPSLFTMPIDLLVSGEGWDTTAVVFNTAADQTFILHLPRRPARVTLDPGSWILKEATNRNDLATVPVAYALGQNFPNPFNPGTTIPFDVPVRSRVRLMVFSVTGQELATLVDEVKWPGHYEVTWDAAGARGGAPASGVYFYRLTGTGFAATRKMLLMH